VTVVVLKTLLQFSVVEKGLGLGLEGKVLVLALVLMIKSLVGLEGQVLGLALVLRVKSLTPSLRFNIRISMLRTGWRFPSNIWEFVERMFHGRMPFLTPTLPTLEQMRISINVFLNVCINVVQIMFC